jgi:Domain of unknown function (DUF4234)
MAETVTIEGRPYLKRNPLGVLGLMFITLGIYFLYWYWKVNDDVKAFERDETMDPTRSLMAMIFGWVLIVPPFIAMYNTAVHVRAAEERRAVQPLLEPSLVIVLMLFLSFGNGIYIQDHLNRLWDRAASSPPDALPATPGAPTLPPAP